MNIGLVDYRLDNFHANTFLRLLREDLHDRGARVVAAWGMEEEPSRAWCAAHRVPWAPSPEDVAQQADALLLLAPDHSWAHLPLARRILPFGRPTFVDKTFADSYEHAEEIFSLSRRHAAPVFSSSALRYAVELEEFLAGTPRETLLDLETRGPAEWERYGIHAVEPLVAVMGTNIRRFRAFGRPGLVRLHVEWEDGRTGLATVNGLGQQHPGFEAVATTAERVTRISMNSPAFYRRLMEHILDFFATGVPPVPPEETLVVMDLLYRGQRSLQEDRWEVRGHPARG